MLWTPFARTTFNIDRIIGVKTYNLLLEERCSEDIAMLLVHVFNERFEVERLTGYPTLFPVVFTSNPCELQVS
jgi:hypothetical protein